MINRKELKAHAKEIFQTNYWPTVLTSLIYYFFVVGNGSASKEEVEKSTGTETLQEFFQNEPSVVAGVFGLIGAFVGITLVIMLIVRVFVFNPYKVGLKTFFLGNYREDKPKFKETFGIFKNGGYTNAVMMQFMRDVYVTLWALLLIIPGIIKSYEYDLADFLIAENPQLNWKDALNQSKEMMKGHKMEKFKLDLSFFGWYILTFIPLLGALYVYPFVFQTDAEFYRAIKA